MDVREKLVKLLSEIIDGGFKWHSYLYESGEQLNNDEIASYLIANGVTVQEWVSVEDELPDNKEHDWVLAQVVEDNGFMHIPKVMEYRQQRNDWFEETYGWLSEHNGAFTVTHWMPLPQPPKGE